jgi:3-hydroxymyristoyl/3-hydroxydecanoyl-(acyl carrier protein) dehydratase
MKNRVERNPQKFPMIQVDGFYEDDSYPFLIGKKAITFNHLKNNSIVPLALLLESMGQTAEFNIRNRILQKKADLLFFGGFTDVRYVNPITMPVELSIIVGEIKQFSNFFSSDVHIWDKFQKLEFVRGKLIHSL